MKLSCIFLLLLTGSLMVSCASYRQNILFQADASTLRVQGEELERNYTIEVDDLLLLDVYTNQGERIIDPNRESFREGGAISGPEPQIQYLVDRKGQVKFPLIEPIMLKGLTLAEAEKRLEEAYEKFYEDAFVILKFSNKRVIVLGAPGGQVIPMTNENMRLVEVLALAKGITPDARANNIRVIRGDEIVIVDMSTFEGYQKGNLLMRPGDIVYVEPVRKPFIEALRDYSPAISIVTSLATLIFIISQTN